MFKAFTGTITSLVGGKKDDEAQSEEQLRTEVPAEDKPVEGGDSKSEEATKDTKVPPPRPAPPLTPAASISKPDTPPDSPEKSIASVEKSEGGSGSDAADGEAQSKRDKIDEKLDEVAEKAKQWGSYLFGSVKAAGASVTAKAAEFSKVMKENSIVGDFMKEQDKFVSEKKEKARSNEAAVAPWVGYNEEESMKTQMLTLSNDKRNFLRNPPAGVQFYFDYETCYPVAMATLAEDSKLDEMRFALVPKLVNEHDFWRNYFYRVSLIKQSTQLTSLTKQNSADQSDNKDQPTTPKSNSLEQEPTNQNPARQTDATAKSSDTPASQTDDITEETNPEAEFVSDAYNLEISDEDLLKEMESLRAGPNMDDDDIEKELRDFEMVGDTAIDEAALEKEIMDEMNKSGEDLK